MRKSPNEFFSIARSFLEHEILAGAPVVRPADIRNDRNSDKAIEPMAEVIETVSHCRINTSNCGPHFNSSALNLRHLRRNVFLRTAYHFSPLDRPLAQPPPLQGEEAQN